MRTVTFLTLALTLPFCAVASAQVVPEPDDDPFYAVPAGVATLPDGAVLDSREIQATTFSVPLPVRAWQVKYKTRDNQDQATATVTTVMVPLAPWQGDSPRPVLSYQTAEDGVGTKCVPSYALRGGAQAASSNSEAETVAMTLALQRGWTVIAPDYEGPRSQFLGAEAEARGVLDGIRAARAFKPAAIAADARYALVGYSGGALASAWAAQLQATYAPELKLAGVALGGVVADLKATFNAFNAGPQGGALIVALIGLDRSYPEAHIPEYLNAAGRQALADGQKDCINDAVLRHPFLDIADYESRPHMIDDPALTGLLARISPLGFADTPVAPIYDYHAIGDELAPIDADRKLVARYCAAGVPVEHVEHPVTNHIAELLAEYNGALDYLADRFAGQPAPSTCPPRPAAPAAQRLTLTISSVKLRGRTLQVRLRLNTSASLSIAVRRGSRTVATARPRRLAAGARTLRVKLSRRPVGGKRYTVRISARHDSEQIVRSKTLRVPR